MTISRITAWNMWAVVSLFYAYQYILRVIPNLMMGDIMQQYNVNAALFGQFSGVYYIGYSLMHIPLGILLDRYGPKKILPICMCLTSIGLLPILLTNIWIYPIIGRLLIGMGSSAAILGAFKIIRFAFEEKQFTRVLSFTVTVGLLGAIYGGGPVNYMIINLGYKMVTALFACIGIALACITYFVTPTITDSQQSSSIRANLKDVLLSPKVMIVCFLSGLLVGPLEGFADVWGSTFLKLVYGFTEPIAAALPSMIFAGMCFGGPILSLIAQKTKSYLGTTAAAGLIMALCFCFLVVGAVPPYLMGILFFVVGICCAYQIIAIYKASQYVKPSAIGLTTAIANMIIMIFGYFLHSRIGWIVSAYGGIDSAKALKYGVAVIPFTLIIGSVGFICVAIHDRLSR